jgi:hypothetical protein
MKFSIKAVFVVFMLSVFLFFGAAGYAVFNGARERDHICAAVGQLRQDLVDVVASGRDRSLKTAQSFPRKQREVIVRQAEESYRETVAKISDPNCMRR